MDDRTKDRTIVGFFILFGMLLLLYAWSWLKSFNLFSQPQKFTAQFSDVAGLSRNATVNVQGVRVGTVEFMEFVHEPEHPERNAKINVHIKITDNTITVPEGSHISIQTLGLVGAKYIEIILPRDAAGNVIASRPLNNSDLLVPPAVEEPVRVELVINRVATRIDDIVSSIDTEQASKALNNLSQASQKLNNNMDRFKDAADSVKAASQEIGSTAGKFGRTADNANVASERASTFFASGNQTMHKVGDLADEFRGTSSKVNKLLDNPNFSADLKETITQAKQTAETIRGAIGDLGTTLKDKDMRDQVVAALQHLENSTNNIKSSLDVLNKISDDKGLRSDVKEVVKNAKEALAHANTVLNDPELKTNINSTLVKVRTAAGNVDVAARQVQQVLGKRAPLLQMLFGKPGKVPASTADPANCPPVKLLPGATPAPVAVPGKP